MTTINCVIISISKTVISPMGKYGDQDAEEIKSIAKRNGWNVSIVLTPTVPTTNHAVVPVSIKIV